MQGQLNLLLLVLLSGAWVADRKGWTCLSGVLIGLAAALKIYPAALILYPLALRKWRGVLAAACSFLAAILLALAVLGSDAFLDYFSTVLPEVSRFRDNWGNASILGFWSKLFDGNYGHVVPVWYAPQLARGLTLVCNLAIVGATLRTAARAKSLRDRDLAFALCMVAMLLVSPVTWDHYFVLAVVPLAILWKACASQRLAAGLVAAIAVLLLTVNAKWLWWATMPANLRPGVQPAGPMYVLTVLSCQFYVLVAFYLLGWSRLGAAKRG
jgi:alpha-1,2-mannosyltransferase